MKGRNNMAGKNSDMVSSKVTYATGGSAVGYTMGKAISTLLMYYVIGDTPGEVKLAIEFLCEGGLGVVGAFVAGYNKSEPT